MKNYESFCEIAFGETKELAKYNENTNLNHSERKRAGSEMTAFMLENTQEKMVSLSKVDEGSSYHLEKPERMARKGDAYPYFLTLVNMDRSEKLIITYFNERLSAENIKKIRNFFLYLK